MLGKKILFTGVFGTGKTTLINIFSEYLKDFNIRYHVSPDVARSCPFDLNKNQNLKTSLYLVLEQLKNEKLFNTSRYGFILSDRGIPDIIAHTKYIIGEEPIDKTLFTQIKQFGNFSCKEYDYIFYSKIPESIPLISDELRLQDSTFQKTLEQIQISYLESLNAPIIILPDLTNDRIKFIKDILKKDIKNALQHFV